MFDSTTMLTHSDHEQRHAREAALVVAAQADSAAFADLYEYFMPIVYRYLLARLASVDDAADVTQHVFVQAFSALPTFRAAGPPFSAWLLRIARNASVDATRRRRPAMSIEYLSAEREPIDLGSDPEDHVLRHEAIGDLQHVIAGLTEDQRDLIVLRFVVGLPTSEIAQIIGAREATVRKRLSRTLHKLREKINERS